MLIASDSIPDYFVISLKGRNALYKNHLMLLEMLAQANWTRPLYFAVTVGRDNYLSLSDNFIQEGLAYRITPFNSQQTGKYIDVNKMYDNIMHKFKYGNISQRGLYLDQTVSGMCLTHRRMFAILASELLRQGDKTRALKVLEYGDKMIPGYAIPYGNNIGGTSDLANCWTACGRPDKARTIALELAKTAEQYINWYMTYSPNDIHQNGNEVASYLGYLIQAGQALQRAKAPEANKYLNDAEKYYTTLSQRGVNINLGQ